MAIEFQICLNVKFVRLFIEFLNDIKLNSDDQIHFYMLIFIHFCNQIKMSPRSLTLYKQYSADHLRTQ